MAIETMKLSVDDKLGMDRFISDENNPHITLNPDYKDANEIKRLVMACPAELYRLEEDGSLSFNHEGCLECGTCRVLSGGKVVKSWDHPESGMGIEYRCG